MMWYGVGLCLWGAVGLGRAKLASVSRLSLLVGVLGIINGFFTIMANAAGVANTSWFVGLLLCMFGAAFISGGLVSAFKEIDFSGHGWLVLVLAIPVGWYVWWFLNLGMPLWAILEVTWTVAFVAFGWWSLKGTGIKAIGAYLFLDGIFSLILPALYLITGQIFL